MHKLWNVMTSKHTRNTYDWITHIGTQSDSAYQELPGLFPFPSDMSFELDHGPLEFGCFFVHLQGFWYFFYLSVTQSKFVGKFTLSLLLAPCLFPKQNLSTNNNITRPETVKPPKNLGGPTFWGPLSPIWPLPASIWVHQKEIFVRFSF